MSFTEIFEPLIADLCHEWQKAIIAERPWKARWIRARYGLLFVMHLIALSGGSVGKIIKGAWRFL